jgi:prepilin-type processing-associated H-X9-DG protein
MVRIVDGTANTVLVGEKHVRTGEEGRCCSLSEQDGSYTFTDNAVREYQVARNIRYRLAKGPNDDGFKLGPGGYWSDGRANGTDVAPGGFESSAARSFGFGSWHPGTCNFLWADGRVTPVDITISQTVRRLIADVADGQPLPGF